MSLRNVTYPTLDVRVWFRSAAKISCTLGEHYRGSPLVGFATKRNLIRVFAERFPDTRDEPSAIGGWGIKEYQTFKEVQLPLPIVDLHLF